MQKLFEVKEYLTKYYGKNSKIVDKVLQFILALLIFVFINRNIGYSDLLSNPFMTIVLSLICTLLPLSLTSVLATVVATLQVMMVSVGMAVVFLILFVIMYAFYFRFAKGKSLILLLVPISFMLKMPVVIPIVYGLIGTPICTLPITVGTVIYYMVDYTRANSSLFTSADDMDLLTQIGTYVQAIVSNREMWCVIIASAICLLLVYGVRRLSVDYAWEIAIIAGALGNINVMAYGYIVMDIQLSYVTLIVESVVAIFVALLIKFLVFAVDYTRTEYLQFEDDEYYYYVKAVPKVTVTIPEKTVKRINERQKTGVIDSEQVLELERMTQKKDDDSEIQRIIDEELKQD